MNFLSWKRCKGKGICFKTVPFCCCVATCFITEYDDWKGECWSATGFDFRWMFFQYINNFLKIRLILWDCTCWGQRSLINMSRFTSILQFQTKYYLLYWFGFPFENLSKNEEFTMQTSSSISCNMLLLLLYLSWYFPKLTTSCISVVQTVSSLFVNTNQCV